MAIVDSIALGKSSGSLGDVTFYQLKGQTVARYRNKTPADPKTPAQLTQRLAMKNVTLAFSLMKAWAKGLDTVKVGKQTYYNRYVSILMPTFPKQVNASALDVLKSVYLGSEIWLSDLILLTPNLIDGHIRIQIDTNGMSYSSGWYLHCGLINIDNDTYDFEAQQITLTNWNNGYVDFDLLGDTDYPVFFYAFNKTIKKGSDIHMEQLNKPGQSGKVQNLIFTADGDEYPCDPIFDTDNYGIYQVFVDQPEVTLTFEYVASGGDHVITYQGDVIADDDTTTFVLPLTNPTNILEIATYTSTGDDKIYTFIIAQA